MLMGIARLHPEARGEHDSPVTSNATGELTMLRTLGIAAILRLLGVPILGIIVILLIVQAC
jgi:hypothetical protein